MLSKRIRLAVLCAAAIAACDSGDSITGPSAPPRPSADLISIPIETEFLPGIPALDPFAAIWADDAGVTESARGSGHLHVGTELRTFAFTAKSRGDGTTQGQFQINNRAAQKDHGTVTCLLVDGNQAWIGGIVTHSSLPDNVGKERVWRVIDNGEGSGDPPDQVTLSDVIPAQLCRTRWFQPPLNIEAGNIQVRDG